MSELTADFEGEDELVDEQFGAAEYMPDTLVVGGGAEGVAGEAEGGGEGDWLLLDDLSAFTKRLSKSGIL